MQGQNLSARYTDADYPGVIFTRGNKRVCVTVKGTRYALQNGAGNNWGESGRLYASRATLEKAAARYAPELLPDIATLPEKPVDALPEFRAAMNERLSAFQATDFRRSDYPWVIKTLKRFERYTPSPDDIERFGLDPEPVESAFDFLRLIVMPKRDELVFQLFDGAHWQMAIYAPSPCAMRALLNSEPVPLTRAAKTVLWRSDDIAVALEQAVSDGTLTSIVKGLPDDLCDCRLPDLPPRPRHRGGAKRYSRPLARFDIKGAPSSDRKAAPSSSDQLKRTV